MSIDRPCPTAVTCPCNESPVMNLSMETDDPVTYVGMRWPVPPPDMIFSAKDCLGLWCYSLISQEDADLCAQRYADLCGGQKFLNTEQTCTVTCPDGSSSTFTCPAGIFAGDSQAAADAKAKAWACQAATISCQNPRFFNTAQDCTVTCPDGSTESWTVPAGVFYAPTQPGANLLAYNWACNAATSLCQGIVYWNTPQSCTATCPNGGTATFTCPAHMFFASTQGEADAQAYAYACQTVTLVCSGMTFKNTAQTCSFTCPDGSVSTATCPAGTFLGPTQEQANETAYNWACGLVTEDCHAKKHKITLSALSPGACHVGQPYFGTITATGVDLAVSPALNYWEITSGTLPPGLTFLGGWTSNAYVNISGPPTTLGSYGFTVKVTAPNGNNKSKDYIMSAIPAPRLYIADANNDTIRYSQPVGANWWVTTMAGSPGMEGSDDGTGSLARFWSPWGVGVDGYGNVFIGDSNNYTIRRMTPSSEVVTMAGTAGIAGNDDGNGPAASFNYPVGVALDSLGNVYVADFINSLIRQVTPAGDVTTVAGDGTEGGEDGIGTEASFYSPSGIAIDAYDTLYIADYGNHTIRKITTPDFVVTTLAGLNGYPGSADGAGSNARFQNPSGIAVDNAGNVYVADTNNQTIRKITPAGMVSTLAGLVNHPGPDNGTGSAARFNTPVGLAVDNNGYLFVADSANYTIRLINIASAQVGTLVGSAGNPGSSDGPGSAATFALPVGLAYY